jgi:predicted nucleic acid-binding protein
MIVVDTNIICYLYLPTEFTKYSEALLQLDGVWSAPLFWRSEFRNVLALYLRKNIIDLITALEIQEQAEQLLSGNEYQINSNTVLTLVHQSRCAAYDCEFIALARSFNQKLITTDKKLIKAFPSDTVTARDFVSGKS